MGKWQTCQQVKKTFQKAIFRRVPRLFKNLFVFKKIKTGWQQYDYKPIYSVWNMDTERKRSLIYTMMDKTEAPKITLATYSAFVTPPEKKQAKNEAIMYISLCPYTMILS